MKVSATDRNKGENGVVDYKIFSFRDDLTQDFTIEKVNDSGMYFQRLNIHVYITCTAIIICYQRKR